jgi:hypothetical protein
MDSTRAKRPKKVTRYQDQNQGEPRAQYNNQARAIQRMRPGMVLMGEELCVARQQRMV